MSADFALRTIGLAKRYGGVVALAGVDVSVRAGQVTALLGENGAGKSTFVACCSGSSTPDAGVIEVDGTEARFANPHDAAVAGVAVVHQEPQMLEEQSVAHNLNIAVLARGAARMPSTRQLEASAGEHLSSLGLRDILDPAAPMKSLSGAQRQLVEIARALGSNPRALFLDEPNASLGDDETELLFAVVRQLRARGVAVVLVTHRLKEAYRLADHVVVMRDGQKVADGPAGEIGIDSAVTLMGGRPRGEPTTVKEAPPPTTDRQSCRSATSAARGSRESILTSDPAKFWGWPALSAPGEQRLRWASSALAESTRVTS